MKKLTLKEKIENLTWTDLINKLKDILLNFYLKFDNLSNRVYNIETIPPNTGGIPDAPEDGTQYGRQDGEWTEITGGSQDLQTTVENGGSAYLASPNSLKSSNIQIGADDGDCFITVNSRDNTSNLSGSTGSLNGKVLLAQQKSTFSTRVEFDDPIATGTDTTGGALIIVPAKPLGTYTIATTSDLLNPVLTTYADNAAAIAGGLPVRRMYQTPTGELRIVV